MDTYPIISIVTACYNGADYLEATIDSVLGQGYPNLEYVVVDGGSTDGSVDIIRRHASRLHWWVSEPDRGHGHALNKGFSRTAGEIMGWLNADDILLPGALSLLAHLFTAFPSVEWLTAQPCHVDPEGRVVGAYPPRRWSRLGFLTGDHTWIQQESTYWRRSLWERAGARVSDEHSMASDFELWMRFFRHAHLHSTYGLVGAFRFRPEQRTRHAMDVYEREVRMIIEDEYQHLLEVGVPPAGSGAWASPALLKYDWQGLRFFNSGHGAADGEETD
jgi:glycosyltransferase involved in cell wall biosynthesis